jgi:4-hydroxybenzoate polyprenyltransferase
MCRQGVGTKKDKVFLCTYFLALILYTILPIFANLFSRKLFFLYLVCTTLIYAHIQHTQNYKKANLSTYQKNSTYHTVHTIFYLLLCHKVFINPSFAWFVSIFVL